MQRLLPASENVDRLIADATRPVSGQIDGINYKMKVVIPDFIENVQHHYSDVLDGEALPSLLGRYQCIKSFQSFGVSLEFEKPLELSLYHEMVLDAVPRRLVDHFGTVIIRNAYLDGPSRNDGHKNRFPHLNFHVDRSLNQESLISIYVRDPFDPEHLQPRTSSTLFTPNLVGYLQCRKEDKLSMVSEEGYISHCDIFGSEDTLDLIGKLLVEHRWDEPKGVGEISFQNNSSVLHASYYRDPSVKGYRIGVRYVE